MMLDHDALLLSAADVCRRLGIGLSHLHALRRAGRFPLVPFELGTKRPLFPGGFHEWKKNKPINRPNVTDDPLAWMLTLEIALQRNDFKKSALAQQQLARLGVDVTYRPNFREEGRSCQLNQPLALGR
jgi:hypothetical protein